jgi:molybdopterin synthase catalytic subunit
MKVLSIAGPSEAGKTVSVEGLVERLTSRGSVATVKHLTHEPDVDTEGKDTARHREAGAETVLGITDDVGWFATGESLSLGTALEKLASEYDYAVVEGFSGSGLPKVALGGAEPEGRVVARAPDAEALDLDAVADAIEDVEPFVTLEELVASVKTSDQSRFSGAIATFTGRVRRLENPEDRPTEYLEFERYDEVAADRLATIRAELEDRDGVYEVRFHHRSGVVEAEEDVVYVVVLAGHRAEAFETVSDGIDRLKAEVPLFKKEVTVSEEFWAHEGPSA